MNVSRAIGRIIDLTVFAPIGLVSLIREQRPRLFGSTDKRNFDKQLAQNRQAVINRIQLAQLAGRIAAERVRASAGAAAPDVAEAVAAMTDADAADPAVSRSQAARGHADVTQAHVAVRAVSAEPAVSADALPISDYESLAAIHVVHRLGTLRPEELEQVRVFEQANRGRRTVLAKIEQLQDAAGT